jgi:hypothetical protein
VEDSALNVSATRLASSPISSAITMSPIVTIASPLHISEMAKMPLERA